MPYHPLSLARTIVGKRLRRLIYLLPVALGLLELAPLPLYSQPGVTAAWAQAAPDNRLSEAYQLLQQGAQQFNNGQTQEALATFQRALELHRQLEDRTGEWLSLGFLGRIYERVGQIQQARTLYEQALTIAQEIGDRRGEGVMLNKIGAIYYSLGQYQEALGYFQQSLTIAQEIGDRQGEGESLNNIGGIYDSLGQYQEALGYYEQALAIHQDISDRQGEGISLNNIGLIYKRLGQYQEALSFYQQSLAIRQDIGDRRGEGESLNNIGGTYDSLGQYQEALNYYQQALIIAQEIGDRQREGVRLNNIGILYDNLGQYQEALNYLQQSLVITREIGDRQGEGVQLNNIGGIYARLGQYQEALGYLQQSLIILREIGDRRGEGASLNNIGGIHTYLEQYQEALDSFQQTLVIFQEIGDRQGEGVMLNNIGFIYNSLGQYQEALGYFQRSLAIRQEIGDRQGEGVQLNNIGAIYDNLGQYQEALGYFQRSIAIFQEVGDRSSEGVILANIGRLLDEQGQSEVAVVLLKQSVNVREAIRGGIRELPSELQQSYANTVADDYRFLADLLLSQGRILEAQQVLELLKVEELREFTRGEVLDVVTREIRLSEAEEVVWMQFDGLIELGKRLDAAGCNAQGFDPAQCTPLFQQRTALTREFNAAVESFIAEFRSRLAQDFGALNPENFIGEADDILQTPGTALIYPVVLEEKLWVLWATSGGVVNSVEVPVTRQQLGEAVLCFRQLLEDPDATFCESRGTTDIQTVAQELYRYLIPPQLEQEFDQQTATGTPVQNLVFSLDRITRYIPMAALHNGEHYLIEDFTISTILSAGLTRTDNPLPSSPSATSVLALGLSDPVPANPLEGIPGFNALHYVPAEIDAIEEIYAGTFWMNNQWNDATFYQLPNYQILHIATHGEFVPARHDQSYLILGNQNPLRIRSLEDLQQSFADLSLVVLSACETALGAADQDGIEINGIAHTFIKAGANTVLASLWQVSDSSTSQLMQRFYSNLSQSTPEAPMPISRALREAQLSLLTSGAGSGDGERGAIGVRPRPGAMPSTQAEIDYSHPYYWAPFILIGNGL